MAIAARFDLELIQYDVVNAFANAELPYDVFMSLLQGYRKPGKILKLNKALYGLQESLILWQRELSSTLRSLGFQLISHELCCFVKNRILVFFYIDDIVLAYWKAQESLANKLISALKKQYELTGGNELQWFLRIEVIHDHPRKLIWLSQSAYIEKIS